MPADNKPLAGDPAEKNRLDPATPGSQTAPRMEGGVDMKQMLVVAAVIGLVVGIGVALANW